VLPVYPEIARAARVQGNVVLDCTISREGRVVDVKVLSGHVLLQPAAVEAVRQWLYRPTLLNGVPVPVVMTVTVRFTLDR
jgi:protein TonB